MPSRLYALEESEIRLFFNATDPEGYPLKYDYELTNKTKMTVAINQTEKIVTISQIKSGNITLKVTDLIDGTDIIHTIEILTVPFSCQNGGKLFSSIFPVTNVFSLFLTMQVATLLHRNQIW